MNKELRGYLNHLRSIDHEEDALEWLRETFPANDPKLVGNAIGIIPKVSWSKEAQLVLAKSYLPAGYPALIDRFIDCFASFMAIPRLCHVLLEIAEGNTDYAEMLQYHAKPVLSRYCNSSRSVAAVDELLRKLKLNTG